MKRIFVGPKQKTIENSDFFDASITLIGDNTKNNIAFHSDTPFEFWNPDNIPSEIDVYNREIAKLTQPTEIMAFNPQIVSQCTLPDNVKLICKNPHSILETLDNKIQTRKLMKNVVSMLEYHTIKGQDFDYNQLRNIANDLVVQLPTGSGGSKTFLCNHENHEQIKAELLLDQDYSISAYHSDNLSYSILCMIGSDQIELMIPAQQLFEISNKIEWTHSDYNINIPQEVKRKLVQYSLEACKKVQEMGYRGVLGIDYIYTNGELYFIEINPRFQGTTHVVDSFLKASRLPSIFEYNYLAFKGKEMPSTKKMKKSIF